jgi:hypothetical protein
MANLERPQGIHLCAKSITTESFIILTTVSIQQMPAITYSQIAETAL